MKLKICGLTSLQDIDYVNQADVDYAGFVFASGHRLEIDLKTARKFKTALKPEIQAVGVFINESYEFIKSLVDEKIIDVVQFHGDNEYKMSVPTIRAMLMENKDSIKPTICDFVVFDSHRSSNIGSTGEKFDWQLIAAYNEKPFFLAGGINISNIKNAMSFKPYGIDLSSGVEENNKKSLNKIMEIAYACRNYV